MSGELYTEKCPICGIYYGIDKDMEVKWRKSHQAFYCPNGHTLSFKAASDQETELKTLRDEVSKLKAELKLAREQVLASQGIIDELRAELEIWKPASMETNEHA